jgi:hypothetical protein
MLEAKDKSSYNFLDKENKNKENLIDNEDFLSEARNFLVKRGGYSQERLKDNNEVYEQFLEHFRYQNVNEVSAVRDLEYAQNANKQDKKEFANLIELYDTMDTDFSLETVKDFAGGILTAPSTYLGIFTGGAGKLASGAATQVSKVALKKLLQKGLSKEVAKKTLRNQINKNIKKEIAKRATITGAIEGTIGTGQGLAQEETRVETGQQKEIDVGQVALTGGASAFGGVISGAIVGKQQTKLAKDAAKLARISESSEKAIAKQANDNAKETIKQATTSGTKKQRRQNKVNMGVVRRRLKDLTALDPDKVNLGKKLKEDIAKAKGVDGLTVGLPTELFENITAATLALAEAGKFKLGRNQRITSGIQQAISKGKEKGGLDLPEIQGILSKYNLTLDTFSLIYKAELSEAGRTLGFSGNLTNQMKRLGQRRPLSDGEKVTDKLIKDIGELEARGMTTINPTEAKQIASGKAQDGFFRTLDRTRLGLMTSQIATTMRNFENAGFRTFIDAGTRQAENIFKVLLGKRELSKEGLFGGVLDVYKGLLDPYEARVVRNIFQNNTPDLATKLFREAADLEYNLVGSSKVNKSLAWIGTKANILNTFSDNVMKQAMFSASLKRRLGTKEFYDIIKSGKFSQIDDATLKGAINDSLEFVYQKSFDMYGKDTGMFEKLAAGTIKAHREMPFFVSSVMPFPRYIANQFKFVYEHAPILGLLPASRKGAKEYDVYNRMAKQTMGLSMLAIAYGWRDLNGQDTEWFEFKDNTGKIIDGRATYGPFAPYMLAADILHRYFNADPTDVGTISASATKYRRDTIQSMLGSSFRTGYGVYAIDKLMIDLTSGASKGEITEKILGEFGANILNTFTLPVAIVKDFYSQFDKFSRAIPETRTGEVDFLSIFLNRGTRAFPDVGPEYDLPLRSPFRTGDLYSINPLEKQIFGFNKGPAKNAVQKEMSELQLGWFDLYSKDPNETIDLRLRRELSEPNGKLNLVDRVTAAMKNPLYADLNRAERVPKFRALVKSIITEARVTAREKIQAEEVEVAKKFEPELNAKTIVTTVDIADYNKLPSYKKNAVTSKYRRLFPIREGEEFYEGKNIRVDADRIIKGVDGNAISVMQWALENAKDVPAI